MSERLRQAEAAVDEACANLAADMADIRRRFRGNAPLMRFLRGMQRFYRPYCREDRFYGDVRNDGMERARFNPLPLLLIAAGTVWLAQEATRMRKMRVGSRRR